MAILLLVIALPLIVPRSFFLLFFHSHVVSDRAAGHGAKNGVMVHVMSGHAADDGAFQTAPGFGGRDAAQRKARGHGGDNRMFHDEGSHMSKGQLGRR
ncbi:MAG TPA: hypothetical protein VID67_01520 [Rhizomicrobium sp.]|jgi:hypothetical protein